MRYLLLIVILTSINCALFAQDTIRLSKYAGNLKTLEVTIKDKKYKFLFDTGGGETFVSPEIAMLFGRDVYGNNTGFRMHGEKITYKRTDSIFLSLNNTKLFFESAGVWDLMSILPADFPKLYGIISLKSFSQNILTINLKDNYLIVENKNSYKKRIQKMNLVNSFFANGLDGREVNIFVGVNKGSHTYRFLFDSGNIGEMLLSNQTAFEWGLIKDTSSQNKEPLTVNFYLGKKHITNTALPSNIIYDGALNFAIISKYIFTINFQKKEIWIN
ncbi:MAG TPA: hypothetical protein VFN30_14175 [Chitinophagaceae bacterium]|nr:hypothetical protein [Chitinophagaceae bacterium]